jgi:predicted Zn-dependent peptidase
VENEMIQGGYKLTRLPNGARIASVNMPWMQTVTIGVWTAVGARHETEAQSGIAHFVEHLLFKGTKRRSARQISEAVEGVGGYINAFTSEDHTCYYAKAGAKHFPSLCDVLLDMYCHSQLAPREIEREREVIREEILMYRDQPGQRVQEMLGEIMWPRHPLGRPLTGSVESIAGLRRTDFARFIADNYNGRSTIAAVAGRITHDEAVAQLAPLLAKLPAGRVPGARAFRQGAPRVSVAAGKHDGEQLNLALGFPAFGRRDERRFALRLMNVILGENMSSRLFQQVRERHGYCYSVHSSIAMFAETGLVNISAGVDPSKPAHALRVIFRELEKLRNKAPARSELRQAQDYAIGQTLMGLESTTNQMMWMGESLLGFGHILKPDDVERRLMAVTPEDVRHAAHECLDRRALGLAVVGPVDSEKTVHGWLK